MEEDQAEPAGNLAPIPIGKITPDAMAQEMSAEIGSLVWNHNRMRKRWNKLRLWNNGTKGARPSHFQLDDPPDLEMIFLRRDEVLALATDIAAMKERLTDMDTPESYLELQRIIGAKESRRMEHLKEIEKILSLQRAKITDNEALISKLLTSRAKLEQDAKHHREKLLADMQKTDERKSEEATVMRLCKEYNVTPEVVYAKYLRKPMPAAAPTYDITMNNDATQDAG